MLRHDSYETMEWYLNKMRLFIFMLLIQQNFPCVLIFPVIIVSKFLNKAYFKSKLYGKTVTNNSLQLTVETSACSYSTAG
ncbi:hypothetical protein T10_9825 [Trichinella papuae]|uniref:Uncharacterized protein n=1 Tax=Trichinella papuae TaxID=268474 RepID=A0A0V1MQ19_9BILA|nr:hypothetical protein T10_9825 [Trichinella papuae]